MSISTAIEKTRLVVKGMQDKNRATVMTALNELANSIEESIKVEGLWTAEDYKKFNGLIKYVLLAIENNDLEFGCYILEQNLLPLFTQLLLKENHNDLIEEERIDSITQKVKQQYTDFMYPNKWQGMIPEYVIQNSTNRSMYTGLYNLDIIQHISCLDYKEEKSLEILMAGCGTGEDALRCAMAHSNASFVFVDLSAASLEMAKKYAGELQIKNVQFIQDDIMTMDLNRQFDIIISSGVIHHLSNPSIGIKNLNKHLKKQGVIVAMVYGEYGRFEIGLFQEALKTISGKRIDFAEGIDMVRKILNDIDADKRIANIAWKQDVLKGEQHIVDLLLNVNEFRYNVKSLRSMIEAGGMKLYEFLPRSTLDPSSYIKNTELKNQFDSLDYFDKCSLAELIHGKLTKHYFLAVKSDNDFRRLSIDDKDSMGYIPYKTPYLIQKTIVEYGSQKHYINMNPVMFYEENEAGYKDIVIDEAVLNFLNLCDGKNSVRAIFNKLKNKIDEEKCRDFIRHAVNNRFLFLHKD